MAMRMAILGVGAIGGVIGAYLSRAGRDITLIDTWPASVERIKTKGLTITAHDEEFTAQARALHLGEVSAARMELDVALLSAKSYDTPWLVKFIEPYLAPGGFIVSAQNSINEEAIADVVGWSRVVGCVVTLGAGMYDPGHVHRTSPPERPAFALGEPNGLVTSRIEAMLEILSDVGITRTTTNLWGERWSKLATNSMHNGMCGITGLKSEEVRENAETRAMFIRIGSEVVRVATALGVSVEPINGIPPSLYVEAGDDGAKMEELEGRIVEGGKLIGTGRPSLAQDIIKGRKTEVDHLNGFVARKGKEVGVSTPVNEVVIALTKRLEAGELKPSLANLKYFQA